MSVAVEEPAQATHTLHDASDAAPPTVDIESAFADAVGAVRKQALATDAIVPAVENGHPSGTAEDGRAGDALTEQIQASEDQSIVDNAALPSKEVAVSEPVEEPAVVNVTEEPSAAEATATVSGVVQAPEPAAEEAPAPQNATNVSGEIEASAEETPVPPVETDTHVDHLTVQDIPTVEEQATAEETPAVPEGAAPTEDAQSLADESHSVPVNEIHAPVEEPAATEDDVEKEPDLQSEESPALVEDSTVEPAVPANRASLEESHAAQEVLASLDAYAAATAAAGQPSEDTAPVVEEASEVPLVAEESVPKSEDSVQPVADEATEEKPTFVDETAVTVDEPAARRIEVALSEEVPVVTETPTAEAMSAPVPAESLIETKNEAEGEVSSAEPEHSTEEAVPQQPVPAADIRAQESASEISVPTTEEVAPAEEFPVIVEETVPETDGTAAEETVPSKRAPVAEESIPAPEELAVPADVVTSEPEPAAQPVDIRAPVVEEVPAIEQVDEVIPDAMQSSADEVVDETPAAVPALEVVEETIPAKESVPVEEPSITPAEPTEQPVEEVKTDETAATVEQPAPITEAAVEEAASVIETPAVDEAAPLAEETLTEPSAAEGAHEVVPAAVEETPVSAEEPVAVEVPSAAAEEVHAATEAAVMVEASTPVSETAAAVADTAALAEPTVEEQTAPAPVEQPEEPAEAAPEGDIADAEEPPIAAAAEQASTGEAAPDATTAGRASIEVKAVVELQMPVVEEATGVVQSDVDPIEDNKAAVETAPAIEELPAEPETVVTVDETSSAASIPAGGIELPVLSVDAPQDEPEQPAEIAEEEAPPTSPSPSVKECPKSPWTPSYSVTTQGPGTSAVEEQEIDQLERLPTLAETSEIVVPQVEVIAESSEGVGPSVAAVEAERPKSPSWVPSYSVSSQGTSPRHSPKVETAELPAQPNQETTATAAEPEPHPELSHTSEVQQIEAVADPAEAGVKEAVVDVLDPQAIADSQPELQEPETSVQTEVVDEAPAPEVLVTVIEDRPVSEGADAEAPKSTPWIASSSQGSSPLQVPQQTATDADVTEIQSLPAAAASEEVAAETLPLTPEPALAESDPAAPGVHEEFTAPAPVIVTEDVAEVAEPQTPPTVPAEEKSPQSPSTPSYSVTQQGDNPLHSPNQMQKELEELNQPPAQAQEAVESEPSIEQPAIHVEETPAPVEENADIEAADKPASRPWTPSYSVTRQGSGAAAGADEVDETLSGLEEQVVNDTSEKRTDATTPVTVAETTNGQDLHNFPTSDETKKVAAKPSLPRLAPVDENMQIQIEESSPPAADIAPSSARARLESTTSSRYFPGGWFSSTAKLPDEGRTSMDHASGEFAKSPSEPSASPALEVPANTPVDGNVEEKHKRGKWCIVM
ncbi:hypothetical protein BD414DRAFT_451042 [Trametes punicea]|nr:hypothetical protein BD414DRAFT_451042 [Trametes punicea]